MHVKIIQKNVFVENVWPANFALFIYIASEQLNGLTTTALTHTSRPYCTASLLRPCYDPGRSTVAMDATGTQRGRSEEPKDAQGRRPSANKLNMHKTVAETLHSC